MVGSMARRRRPGLRPGVARQWVSLPGQRYSGDPHKFDLPCIHNGQRRGSVNVPDSDAGAPGKLLLRKGEKKDTNHSVTALRARRVACTDSRTGPQRDCLPK